MSTGAKNITGFILAGGKSQRMGQDKGLIHFRGMPMIQYSIKALSSLCSSIIILANDDKYDHLGYQVIKDKVADSGPLAGICSGLEVSETDLNLFLTCDSPLISIPLLQMLIDHSENVEAVVPRYDNRVYPLTALYKKACLAIFEENIHAGNLRVKDATQLVNTHFLDISSDRSDFNKSAFVNINTPEELENYENNA